MFNAPENAYTRFTRDLRKKDKMDIYIEWVVPGAAQRKLSFLALGLGRRKLVREKE